MKGGLVNRAARTAAARTSAVRTLAVLAAAVTVALTLPTALVFALPSIAVAADVPVPADFTAPDPAMLRDSIVDLSENTTDLLENIEDVAVEEQTSSGSVITLATDILFDFDSAALSDEAVDRITEIAQDIPSGTSVSVHGHTDSKGEDAYNQTLSEERADAVAEVLATADPSLDIEAQGFGETEPVASNESGGDDDPDGRAQNRRVEIHYDD